MKKSTHKQSLYSDLATLYDKLYSYKDYEGEVKVIDNIIQSKMNRKPSKVQLLDLACGTGQHLRYLNGLGYSCTGIDNNEGVLEIARSNVKNGKFIKQDISRLKLTATYDVMTCFFSSIQYITDTNQMKEFISEVYTHLSKGGLLVFDLQYAQDRWKEGHAAINTYKDEDDEILMLFQSWSENGITHWKPAIIHKHRGALDMSIDEHTIRIYSVQEISELLRQTGFKVAIQNGFSQKKYTLQSQIPLIVAKK